MDTVLHDGHGPVVLDLRELRFMDVSGLRLAVRLEARAQLHGVPLLACWKGTASVASRVRADRHAALRRLTHFAATLQGVEIAPRLVDFSWLA